MCGFPPRKGAPAYRLLLLGALMLSSVSSATAQPVPRPEADGQAWYDFGGSGSYLGVYLEDLSGAMRKALGLEDGSGILIERLPADGPADRAGLQAGDVLLSLGGERTDSASRLSRVLDGFQPGEEVEVVVWRQGKQKKLPVTLGQRPGYALSYSDGEFSPPAPRVAVAPRVGFTMRLPGLGSCCSSRDLGIQTEDLTGQLAEFFQVPRGVLVTWVTRDSAAHKAGVKAGDVLTGVGDQPVQNRSDLEQTLAGFSQIEELQLVFTRRGKEIAVSLKP